MFNVTLIGPLSSVWFPKRNKPRRVLRWKLCTSGFGIQCFIKLFEPNRVNCVLVVEYDPKWLLIKYDILSLIYKHTQGQLAGECSNWSEVTVIKEKFFSFLFLLYGLVCFSFSVYVFFSFHFQKALWNTLAKKVQEVLKGLDITCLFIVSFFNKREGKALNISLKHPEDKMYSLKSEKKNL